MKSRWWFIVLVGVWLGAGLWVGAVPASAATCTWTGAGSTDWATPGNWDAGCGGGVPGSGDTVIIGAASNNPVVSANVTVNTVQIQNGGVLLYSAGSGVTFNITMFTIADGGKYIHNRAAVVPLSPSGRSFSTNSTVEIQQYSSSAGALPAFGNLIVNTTLTPQLGGYLATVNGNLIKQGTGELRLAKTEAVTLTIGGNLDVQGGILTIQSSTVTATSAITVNGNVTVAAGAQWVRGASATGGLDFNVAGQWTNDGTFSAGNSVVDFNGVVGQTINGASPLIVTTLAINNAAGVTATKPITVSGTLNLVSGDLTVTGNTLTLSGAVIGAHDVVGTVRRANPATGVPLAFNNASTVITFTTAPSQMDVALTKSAPSYLTRAVNRYYTLTPSGATAADVQLAYRASEIPVTITDESKLRLWRYDTGQSKWILQGGVADVANHWVTLPGVAQFSDWAITDSGAGSPTAVTLETMTAWQSSDSIQNGIVGLGWLGLLAIGAFCILAMSGVPRNNTDTHRKKKVL